MSALDKLLTASWIAEQRLMSEVEEEVTRIYTSEEIKREMRRFRRNKKVSDDMVRQLDKIVESRSMPSDELWRLLARHVSRRTNDLDNVIKLLEPGRPLTEDPELKAEVVKRQRREMNEYWSKETKRFRDDIAKSVRQAARQGLSVDELAAVIEDRTGVSSSRAILIATDQTRKAATRAEYLRQKRLGIKAFRWRTMGDNRVRSTHRVKEGKVFLWASRTEKPGDAIGCRCRALPAIGGDE